MAATTNAPLSTALALSHNGRGTITGNRDRVPELLSGLVSDARLMITSRAAAGRRPAARR